MNPTLNISSDFYWLGCLDPNLRHFDIVMETEFGTTYNAYLLKGSNGTALFETVKECFFDSYLSKLKTLTSLDEITHIILNHTEPDHIGSVAKLLPYVPNAVVVGSPLAIKYLTQIINVPFNSLAVTEKDTISLGNKTIRFISVPQLHWPDTMYSYIEEDKILVTCDSFGAHYSDNTILRSELDESLWADFDSAYKYYYDMIMGPFKPFVLKALDKIKSLPISFVCPGHGMILDSSNFGAYMDKYLLWSTPTLLPKKIVVAYVSAYGYTKELAEYITEGINNSPYDGEVVVLDLEHISGDEAMSHINTATGLLLGSPTILADALPPIWNILTSLNPVIHKGLTAGVFGSYGWSGEGIKNIAGRLAQLKCTTPCEPFGCVFRADEDTKNKAIQFGADFASSIK